ncbi:MAG: hypothetical protein JWQ08_1277, partial [Deinococcus sp.]|nr:hypothetical protein [Deinococcus sp.]
MTARVRMLRRVRAAGCSLLLTACTAPPRQEVVFPALDQHRVYATAYPAQGRQRALLLLFHQALSNQEEYAPLIPRLTSTGCGVLTVDLRAGGAMWGSVNATWVQDPSQSQTDYLASLADMEGALEWAHARWRGPVLVWGSSYTAGLVFVLAARHPAQVAGVLAFSPAEYVQEQSGLVRGAATHIRVPTYVTSTPGEAAAAIAIFQAVHSPVKQLFVPSLSSVHAASVLRED